MDDRYYYHERTPPRGGSGVTQGRSSAIPASTPYRDWEPPEDLKVKINEMLFPILPGEMTINEADELATNIYTSIVLAVRGDSMGLDIKGD